MERSPANASSFSSTSKFASVRTDSRFQAWILLPSGGGLFLYGPFMEPDIETAPSNLSFDLSLKSRNPTWGIRRLDDVTALAAQHGLELTERIAMPANNLTLVFRKT